MIWPVGMIGDTLEKFELKIPLRLSDYLSLQFWCLQKSWFICPLIFACLFLIGFPWFENESFSEKLLDVWRSSFPFIFLCGVVGGFGAGFFVVIVRWFTRKLPRELHIAFTDDDKITVFGEKLDYSTRWSQVTHVAETKSAYFIEVKKPFVRLPKRGFASEQQAIFERLLKTNASSAASRRSSN
jgi:hypothetical protein